MCSRTARALLTSSRDRAEPGFGAADQVAYRVHVGKVGANRAAGAAASAAFDFVRPALSAASTRAVAVDRHGKTVCRKILDDGAADPLRSAGHQRRNQVCSSCLILGREFVECRLRPQSFAESRSWIGRQCGGGLCPAAGPAHADSPLGP